MVIAMKYARVVDSIVYEVFTPPVGFTFDECFTPEVVAQFVHCPAEVEAGWIQFADGSFAPAPEPEPEA